MKTQLKLCVASKNPVKIAAANESLSQVFHECGVDVCSIDAPSLVSEQPMSQQETWEGAINRVKYAQEHNEADFYISFEGGVDVIDEVPSTYAVVCVASNGRVQTGRSSNLPLPPIIYQQLLDGDELGPAMDRLFNTQNIKHKGGAIGQLTQSLCTRKSVYVTACIMTLAPFRFPDLYPMST